MNKHQKERREIYEKWKEYEFPAYEIPTEPIVEDYTIHLCGSREGIPNNPRKPLPKDLGGWKPSETIEQAYESHLKDGKIYGRFDELELPENPEMDYDGHVKGLKATLYPETQFYQDVDAGKVILKDGLKLSKQQAFGKDPKYWNYYNKPLEGFDGKTLRKAFKNAEKERPGLVLKISGDYDKEMLRDFHNCWAVVSEIIDEYHLRVVVDGSNKELIIRDTDIKWWVADEKNQYVNIGDEMHKEEIMPLIQNVTGSK